MRRVGAVDGCSVLTMPEINVPFAAGHYKHHRSLAEMHEIVGGCLHRYGHEKLDRVAMAMEGQLGVCHATSGNKIGCRKA